MSENLTRDEDQKVLGLLQSTLKILRDHKPSERSETARRYAVTITEMEKVVAYFKTYVVEDE